MPKKNPIKKRKQGSQKPNPIPVGKPEQYMGDKEWEQYNEPQGAKKDMVNPEGLGGISIGEAIRRVVNQVMGTVANVLENPTKSQMEAILQRYIDLDGIADEHGNLYLWSVDAAEHADVAREFGIDPARAVFFVYGLTDPERVVYISSYGMMHRDHDLVKKILSTNKGYLRVFKGAPVDTSEMEWGEMRGDMAAKLDREREQRAAPYEGLSEQIDEEMGPLGGFMAPLRGSDSKFAIPDNMAIIDPESFEFSSLGKTKKDAKKVRKQVNKNIKKQKSNPNFEKELTESNVEYLKSLGDQMQEVLQGVIKAVEWSADKSKTSSLRAVKVRDWLNTDEGKQRVINDWVEVGAPLPLLDGMGPDYKHQGEEFMSWLRGYLHDSDDERRRQEQARNRGSDAWRAYVKQYMSEMIRLPIFSLISGEYEVRNGEQIAGFARVKDGVIEELTCASGAEEDYRGEVLTHLLNTIVEEADMQNSNLSLQLQNKDDDDMKRFLERFGFKHVGHGVMQRTAGAVRPPSVQYTSGQEGP